MAGLRPFNLADVYSSGENILAARSARDPNSLKNRLAQVQLDAARYKAENPGSEEQYGYNTIPGVDENGNLTLYRPGRSGGLEAVQFPEGVTPGIPGRYIDMGSGQQFVPSIAGVNLGGQPQTTGETFGNIPGMGGQPTPVPQPQPAPTTIKKDYAPGQSPEARAAIKKAETQAVAQAEAQSPDALEKAQTEITEAQDAIGVLETMLAPVDGVKPISLAYGKMAQLPGMLVSEERNDAVAQRDRILAIIQLAQVGKLKGTGPITENEQKILKAAAAALQNTLISDTLAEKEMRRVMSLLKSNIARNKGKLGEQSQTVDDPLGIR